MPPCFCTFLCCGNMNHLHPCSLTTHTSKSWWKSEARSDDGRSHLKPVEGDGWWMLVRADESSCRFVPLSLRGASEAYSSDVFFFLTLVYKTIKVKGRARSFSLYFLCSAVVLLKSQYQTDYLLSVCRCNLLCITSLCGLSLLPILFVFACGNHSDPNLSPLLVPAWPFL